MGLLASLFVKIGADTKDLQKGLTATKSGLSDVTKGVLSSVAGFATWTGAIMAAGKALQDTVNDTVDYAMQVRDLSLLIGSTAEESSKLIQAADDVFISYDTMTKAMQAAIRQGVSPTIEGMGRLADQYVAIQDPIAKTKFLMDNFGRAGADLAPLMELGAKGITALGEEAEKTGLVMSEDSVKAAKKYKESLDALNDSVAGVKTIIGNELIPVLIEAVEWLNTGIDSQIGNAQASKVLDDAYKAGLITEKEYLKLKYEIAGAYMQGEKGLAKLTSITQTYTTKLEKINPVLDWNADAYISAEDAAKAYGKAVEETSVPVDKGANYLKALNIQLGYNAEAMGKLKGAMNNEFFSAQEDFAESQQDIKDKMNGVNGEIATALAQGYSEHGTKVQGLRGDYEELATQYATNATEHEKMKKQIIFDLLDQKMAVDGYLESEKNYLNELALSWGLVTQEELNFEEAMADWATLITNPMSLTKEELQGILDNIDMLPAETVLTIKTLLEGEEAVYNLIQALNGTYTMDLITGFGLPIQPGKAGGGPVYYGNAYPVGERGPELFVPDQSGYIVPNDELQKAATSDNNNQMIRLLQQIASNRAIDESRLARVIRDAMLQVVG